MKPYFFNNFRIKRESGDTEKESVNEDSGVINVSKFTRDTTVAFVICVKNI